MKKYIGLTFVSCVIALSGCSLDEDTYGKTTSRNFYSTQSEIQEALTGAYLQLRTTWNEYALNFYFVGDCSTDDALKGSTDGDRAEVLELSNFTTSTTNGEVGRRWEILYRLIARCNEVIAHAPGARGDEAVLTRYMNEAKALRAFGYYELVTTFGGVPLVTVPMKPTDILKTPRASADDVWAQIVSDCKDAEALPAKGEYSAEEQYRVTRGFAKAMLAKTYMFRHDYENAEKTLNEIVNVDKDYSLLPDYGLNLARIAPQATIKESFRCAVPDLESQPYFFVGDTSILSLSVSEQMTEGYKRLAAATCVPLCTGEDIYLKENFIPLLESGALGVIHPDILSTGGILETKKIGDMAQDHGVAMAIHMAETPIAFMAAAHTATATENFLALEFHSVDIPWWQDLVEMDNKPLIKNGFVEVPDAPGLGIKGLNDEVIREHMHSSEKDIWLPTDAWDKEWSHDRLWS